MSSVPTAIGQIPKYRGAKSRSALKAAVANTGCLRVDVEGESAFLELANEIGTIAPSPRAGELIEVLSVEERSAKRNSMTSRFGTGSFPLHTDQAFVRVPPRYVLLYSCTPQFSRGTELVRLSSLRWSSQDDQSFVRGVWSVDTGVTTFLTPLMTTSRNSHERIFRYDPCIMRPLCSLARRAAHALKVALESASITTHTYTEGECLILDNWNSLHGRAPGSGDEGQRKLLRISVN